MSCKCVALRRCQQVADIADELHQPLGCLVGQLQMRQPRRFQRGAINRTCGQTLDGLRVRSLQLRVQRQQIIDRLLHQRSDLRFLCVGRINLDIEVLQQMIDMRGDIRSAMSAAHHALVPACARAARKRTDPANQRGGGNHDGDCHAAE